MEYEWDPQKAAANVVKHQIAFADAVAVFSDPLARTIAEDGTEEERFVILGQDAFARLLVVVFTWRGATTIRIISARLATRRERRYYEEQI